MSPGKRDLLRRRAIDKLLTWADWLQICNRNARLEVRYRMSAFRLMEHRRRDLHV